MASSYAETFGSALLGELVHIAAKGILHTRIARKGASTTLRCKTSAQGPLPPSILHSLFDRAARLPHMLTIARNNGGIAACLLLHRTLTIQLLHYDMLWLLARSGSLSPLRSTLSVDAFWAVRCERFPCCSSTFHNAFSLTRHSPL